MDNIPSEFWMVMITVLTLMFALILYYVAMLLRETTFAVGDMRITIQRSNDILEHAEEIVKRAESIVHMVEVAAGQISENIVVPIVSLGAYIKTANGFLSGFLGSSKKSESK